MARYGRSVISRRWTVLASMVCIALCTPTRHAVAQANQPPARPTAQALVAAEPGGLPPIENADATYSRALRQLQDRPLVDPLSGDTTTAAQHQISVVADKGEVNGRARFYLPIGENADWILTFAAPLTGSNATFINEAGLGKNATANMGFKIRPWSKVTTPTKSADSTDQTIGNYRARLNEVLAHPVSVPAALEILRRAALDRNQSGAPISGSTLARGLTTKTQADISRTLAAALDTPTLVASPERFFAAAVRDAEVVRPTWSTFITPGFEYARSAGEYLTSDTHERKEFDEQVGFFTASGGLSYVGTVTKPDGKEMNVPRFFLGSSFRGGKAVNVTDPEEFCLPATGGALNCVELPEGQPSRTNFNSFTFELRYWEIDKSLGVNPRYTRTSQEDDVAGATTRITHTFEIPIYFMRSVTDIGNRDFEFGADLVGGVNVGYRSGGQRNGAFVTLFFTKAFGLP